MKSKVKIYDNKVYEVYEDENGNFHRESGPAVINENGDKHWYLHGKLHRIDGPAIEWSKHGSKKINQWWIEGKLYSKKEFNNHPLVVALKEKQLFEKIINEKKLSRKVKL